MPVPGAAPFPACAACDLAHGHGALGGLLFGGSAAGLLGHFLGAGADRFAVDQVDAVFTLGFCGSPHQNDGIGGIQYDICRIRNFHHIHSPEEWMQKGRPSPGGRKKAAI
ncbi:hypothetical protein DXA70_06085 [Faecalibacterium sp. OF04-11AC]|nr:hypothetical protein DXA70_06085 [Faecalibacterium sp. OF04-11AC]